MNTPSREIMDEIAKFQGRWKQTSWEADGESSPPDDCGSEPSVTFTDDTFVVIRQDGSVAIEGTFVLDPTREPKEIDYTDTFGPDAGKTFPAIYRFDGDQLTFCAADMGMERPKVFRTRIGDTLRVHRRAEG